MTLDARPACVAHVLPLLAVASAALCSACAGDNDPAPTFAADVGPLLAAHCMPCHASGGPRVALDDATSVSEHASLVLAMAESGEMPPGVVDRSGACGSFTGASPLSSAELSLLAAWIAAGRPLGEHDATIDRAPPSARDPELPRQHDTASSDGPELSLDIPPLAGEPIDEEVTRCHVIALEEATGQNVVVGIDTQPVSSEALHHVMVFALGTASAVQTARVRDAADPGAGWACPAAPDVAGALLLDVWVPGRGATEYPPGTGLALDARALLVQVHVRGGVEPAETGLRIALRTSASVNHVLRPIPIALDDFALSPDEGIATRGGHVTLDEDLVVWGIEPHMHGRGRRLSADLRGRCLGRANEWELDRQEVAFFVAPRELHAGDVIDLECTWDVRSAERIVVSGEHADDEMCTMFLLASPARR